MTARPRLCTGHTKRRAVSHAVEVFSMDDPAIYGPELHRLPFSRAVKQGSLSDYKVVVLAMSEQHVDAALQVHLAADGGEINITDAAKIIGCWRALQNPENRRRGEHLPGRRPPHQSCDGQSAPLRSHASYSSSSPPKKASAAAALPQSSQTMRPLGMGVPH